jgi:hypothetical protein
MHDPGPVPSLGLTTSLRSVLMLSVIVPFDIARDISIRILCNHWEQRNRIESSSGVGSCSGELRETAVEGDREEMARKELDCAKKTSCMT